MQVQKAQCALLQLPESFPTLQLKPIDLYGANGKPKWFLDLNPAGTVPVLIVHSEQEETVLTESDDIVCWVAEQLGTHPLPALRDDLDFLASFSADLKPLVQSRQRKKILTALKSFKERTTTLTSLGCSAAVPFIRRLVEEFNEESQASGVSNWYDNVLLESPKVREIVSGPYWWWW